MHMIMLVNHSHGGFFMDKAIIVGIYEFIGFNLCEALLQEGIEVYGVHIPTVDSELVRDEKRLLIGRNSNYIEKDISSLSSLNLTQQDTYIFLDYYSFYMKKQEKKFLETVHSHLSHQQLVHSVSIMPIQVCMKEENRDSYKNKGINSPFIFYVPTIYGPWQPSNFFFHKALYQSNENHIVEEREWTGDAIYVQDAIQSILYSIENKKQASYLLKSNDENQWSKIASTLLEQIPVIDQKSNREINKDIINIEVKATSVKEGLEKQKRYISQIQER
jgi:nucleoside-diphosphate-sugar epimerase